MASTPAIAIRFFSPPINYQYSAAHTILGQSQLLPSPEELSLSSWSASPDSLAQKQYPPTLSACRTADYLDSETPALQNSEFLGFTDHSPP